MLYLSESTSQENHLPLICGAGQSWCPLSDHKDSHGSSSKASVVNINNRSEVGETPLCCLSSVACPDMFCSYICLLTVRRGSLIYQPPTGLNLWGSLWKPVREQIKARQPGFAALPQNAMAPASKPSPHLSPLQLLQTASFPSVLRSGNNIILIMVSAVHSTKDSTSCP